MAGDWIPMRTNLAADPAVIQVACATGLPEPHVVGLLHRLWGWANEHLVDGYARGVTLDWIDRHVSTPGFAAALLDAGWLRTSSGGVELPNFDRWNSQGAKKRVLAADRMRKSRCAPSATKAQPEKRREEKNKDNSSSKSSAALPPPPPPVEKKPPATPQTPHHQAIAAFCSAWQAKYSRKYPFNGGKDASAIAWMLKQVEGDEAKLTVIVARYLDDEDPFFASCNHDIATLRNKFTRWAVEAPARNKPTAKNSLFNRDAQIMSEVAEACGDTL